MKLRKALDTFYDINRHTHQPPFGMRKPPNTVQRLEI